MVQSSSSSLVPQSSLERSASTMSGACDLLVQQQVGLVMWRSLFDEGKYNWQEFICDGAVMELGGLCAACGADWLLVSAVDGSAGCLWRLGSHLDWRLKQDLFFRPPSVGLTLRGFGFGLNFTFPMVLIESSRPWLPRRWNEASVDIVDASLRNMGTFPIKPSGQFSCGNGCTPLSRSMESWPFFCLGQCALAL